MLDDTSGKFSAENDERIDVQELEDAVEAGKIKSTSMSEKDATAYNAMISALFERLKRPVRPADIVAHVKTPEGSHLSHLFEWNDSIAAAKYREHQAAYFCRIVKVVITAGEAPMRTIVRVVNAEKQSGYVPLGVVQKNDEFKKQLMGDTARSIRLFREKLKTLHRWLGTEKLDRALSTIGELEKIFEDE